MVKLKSVVNIAISVALFAFLIYKIKPQGIIGIFSSANLPVMLLATPFVIIAYLIRSAKWNYLLACLNLKLSLPESLRLVLIGTFYGMMTPAKAGELARASYFKKNKAECFASVMWDKVTDVLLLAILSTLAVLLFANKAVVLITAAITAAVLAAMLIAMNERVVNFFRKLLGIKQEHISGYLEAMRLFARRKRVLAGAMAYGLAYYLFNAVVALIMLKALDPAAPAIFVLALPLIILLGNLPITFAGMGLRETVSVITIGALHGDPALAFSFSLMIFISMTLLPGLIGYVLALKN